MSLLWTQAMPWYNDEREHEHEGDDEYPLRDPNESMKDRGQRYVQHVVDNHGVRPEVAQKAIQHVIKSLDQGHRWGEPTDYGFASAQRVRLHDLMKSPEAASKLYKPETWMKIPVKSVPLDQEPIHASQDFVRPASVAHNLFHSGKRQPHEDTAVGDPDYDPRTIGDEEWYGEDDVPDHEGGEHTKHPRFMRLHSGKLMLMDGHHRVATDLLLGKRQTYGRIVHQSELE